MSKIKTRKTWSKRLKVTKTGKVLKRRAGQSHFNAKESGKIMRKKRRDQDAQASIKRSIKVQMPHA